MSQEHPTHPRPEGRQSQLPPGRQWHPRLYSPAPPPKKPRSAGFWFLVSVGIAAVICIVAVLIFKGSSFSSASYSSANVVDTPVAALDKDGSADNGMSVHFTATILGFVKDSSGNTGGANVDDQNFSGVLQVEFPGGTDLNQLNTGDTLEAWGVDQGVYSGQNAFGATIRRWS
jgi:hypothetical protein